MLTLAIDSTAKAASAALLSDGVTLCEYTVNAGNTHSVTLLPMIESMLKMTGRALCDVDIFACSAGPGSFTGVRIGAATLKGLAFPTGKPCVPVSALNALAYNLVGQRGIICPAMNARREQVYTALFRSDGEQLERLTEDMAIAASRLADIIADNALDGEKVFFCGDGYSLVESFGTSVTPERLRTQSASSVAHCAEKLYMSAEDKSVFSPEKLSPIYLRKPQAEREREERLAAEAEKTEQERNN